MTRNQLMDIMSDHYEGSELDMTLGVFAGPFGNPNRLEGGSGLNLTHAQLARAISIPRTNYGAIGEARWGSGTLADWLELVQELVAAGNLTVANASTLVPPVDQATERSVLWVGGGAAGGPGHGTVRAVGRRFCSTRKPQIKKDRRPPLPLQFAPLHEDSPTTK